MEDGGPALSRLARELERLRHHPRVRRAFAIDFRALAALRIGLGGLLLFDLAKRLPDLQAHYTDLGVLPRAAAPGFSLYSLSGGTLLPAALFAVAALVAVMLVVGFQTWPATAISWVLLVSLYQRNPLVLDAGDHVLVLLLLWSLFLPLGARASVDRRCREPLGPIPDCLVSMGGIALLIQIATVYVFAALLKSPRAWFVEAGAMREALQLDFHVTALGHALSQLPPALLRLGSRVIWLLELLGPFIAFLPFAGPWPRLLTALTFIGFHLGLILSFDLGLFPYVCIVAWLVFVPREAWDWLEGRAAPRALARGFGAVVGAVARMTAALGRRRAWLAGQPVDARGSLPGGVLALLLIAFVLLSNLGTLEALRGLGATLDRWIPSTYFSQRWKMFAPAPPLHDVWWVAPALLEDGTVVDLVTGRSPVDWSKPASARAAYPDSRWRKFLHFSLLEHADGLKYYAAYLRRRWDGEHAPDRRVTRLELYFMNEHSLVGDGSSDFRRTRYYAWPDPAAAPLGARPADRGEPRPPDRDR